MSLPELVQEKLNQGVPVSHIERMYGVRLDPQTFRPKPRPPIVLIHSQDRLETYDPGPDEIAEVASLLPDISDASLRRIAAMALGMIKDRCGLEAMNKVISSAWVAVSVPRPNSLDQIAHNVAQKHGLTMDELCAEGSTRKASWARQEAYAEARKVKGINGESVYSYPAIGRYFKRNHTTVIDGERKYLARIAASAAG